MNPPSSSLSGAELRVAMVAGEASGDLLAALLLQGMRARWPLLQSFGIGGPHMAKQGFTALWPHSKLAVHGLSWELLWRLREILGIRRQLRAQLVRNPPTVFVGIDAPDFNLGLEAALKAKGQKTIHFVCPSVWAWRANRIEQVKRSVDHMLCVFPFEPALLAAHGIAATFVGHPLANVIPMQADTAAARVALGLSPTAQVVALLPGSRGSEINHLALRFFKAAACILQRRPSTEFVVPVVPGFLARVRALAYQSGIAGQLKIVQSQSHTALAACDVALVASGTATLEAALFKRPMVIAYHANWLSWHQYQRKRLQPWVGLPNILCEEFVVPELLQDQATPEALAEATLDWLQAYAHDPARVQRLQARFESLHHALRRDTAALATVAIQQVLSAVTP